MKSIMSVKSLYVTGTRLNMLKKVFAFTLLTTASLTLASPAFAQLVPPPPPSPSPQPVPPPLPQQNNILDALKKRGITLASESNIPLQYELYKPSPDSSLRIGVGGSLPDPSSGRKEPEYKAGLILEFQDFPNFIENALPSSSRPVNGGFTLPSGGNGAGSGNNSGAGNGAGNGNNSSAGNSAGNGVGAGGGGGSPSVPEPVTTFGSVVAVGFGTFLRKKYSRQLQKQAVS